MTKSVSEEIAERFLKETSDEIPKGIDLQILELFTAKKIEKSTMAHFAHFSGILPDLYIPTYKLPGG